MIEFFVPGQPVGKGRPRIGRAGAHARMFTPEKTVSYESLVRLAAADAMAGAEPLQGPVKVRLDIVVTIPASWSVRRRQAADAGFLRPTTKPDIDNIEKAVFDACNGVAWRDDVQVVEVAKVKRYGRRPGVTMTIERALGEAA